MITGAAKDIGKSIAVKRAENGVAVGLIDFDESAGLQTQNEIRTMGCECELAKADVSFYESICAVKQQLIEVLGEIDILVVNAGVSKKYTIHEIEPKEWDRIIAINLSGSFYTMKAFYEEFAAKKPEDEGKTIFITSASGITGTGGGAHYAASKSGQHGLMRTVFKELGKNGGNVNAIAPRVIVTDIFDMLYPTAESKDNLKKQIPIGRFGYPEEVDT